MKTKYLNYFLALLLLGIGTLKGQTMIDRYSAISNDDEFGHLFNFADKLKSNANKTGMILISKDESETVGSFLRHFYGVRAFMISTFGVSPNRFEVVYGGDGRRDTAMYLQSVDSQKRFTSFELDETLRGKITKRTLFDYTCLDCDQSPFINQFIFREGMQYLAKVLLANPGTYSKIFISRVESLSRTPKERKKLRNEIYDRLTRNSLKSTNRVTLQFVNGIDAKIYIFPRLSPGIRIKKK